MHSGRKKRVQNHLLKLPPHFHLLTQSWETPFLPTPPTAPLPRLPGMHPALSVIVSTHRTLSETWQGGDIRELGWPIWKTRPGPLKTQAHRPTRERAPLRWQVFFEKGTGFQTFFSFPFFLGILASMYETVSKPLKPKNMEALSQVHFSTHTHLVREGTCTKNRQEPGSMIPFESCPEKGTKWIINKILSSFLPPFPAPFFFSLRAACS